MFSSFEVGFAFFLSGLLMAPHALGHGTAGKLVLDDDRAISFPDTKEFKTLAVDLHTHSVFSDGHVWPNVRVAEAQRDGLDAVAITEHLEYQPHKNLLPNPNLNAAYLEALTAAEGSELMVISGSEITRQAPAGHMNAVFLKDANELMRLPDDIGDGPLEFKKRVHEWPAEEAVSAANRQGAFVFWNHAWWSPDTPNHRTRMTDFQRQLVDRKHLHGIEVVNGHTYNEEAHQIALDHDLAFIGTSDVHNLVDWDYTPHNGGHRPVTLVLATERSPESLKQALFAHRTIVWFENLLIGRQQHLLPLLEASLTIDSARYHPTADVVLVTLTNHSDAEFRLRHVTTKGQSFSARADIVDVAAHDTLDLTVKPEVQLQHLELGFEVMNALTEPNTHPRLMLRRPVLQRVSE